MSNQYTKKAEETKTESAPPVVQKGTDYERESLPASQDPVGSVPVPKQEAESLLDATLEAQVTHLGRATAEKLKEYPQILTMVPKDPLNKGDEEVVVGINGWVFQIKRGEWVLLPSPVVERLQRGGYNPSTRSN